jgi:hypothetical protein
MLLGRALRGSRSRWICPDCAVHSDVSRKAVSASRAAAKTQQVLMSSKPNTARPFRTDGRLYRLGPVAISTQARSLSKSSTFNHVSAVPTPRPAESINAPSPIPLSTQSLHTSLRELELLAGNFLSLARVKLAIKSVETGLQGNTRVALLALNPEGKQDVQRLLRVILADVLGDEKSWEKELLEQGDGRAVLIKYGEENMEQAFWNKMLRTIYVDSPLLKDHGVEILISVMDVHVGDAILSDLASQRSVLDTLLVPMAETAATDGGGGRSVVSYPVHRSILVAKGLGELVDLGRFEVAIGGRIDSVSNLVKVVASGQGSATQDNSSVSLVNVAAVEDGIAAFRSDVGKSLDYEHAWFNSGVPALSSWLFPEKTMGHKLKTDIKAFVKALISDTEARVEAAEKILEARIEASDSIAINTRDDLIKSAESWERRAHEELQTTVEASFRSPMWKKLAWWRLLWRVDDLEMVGHDLLQRQFLTRAERELIYLFGRMNEAGLLQDDPALLSPSIPASAPTETPATDAPETKASLAAELSPTPLAPTSATLYSEASTRSVSDLAQTGVSPTPYPTLIPSTRSSLTASLLALQARAQALLVTSLSTASLGGALAALTQISSPLMTIYESGAVAALGFALAAVRLQIGWDKARTAFEGNVKESGRSALIGTGAAVKEVVIHGGKIQSQDMVFGEEMEREQITDAKKALMEVKDALSRMGE